MFLKLATLIALLLAISKSVDGAVVGIDFASNFVKVALVSPGTVFHIVEDETSKRKFPNTIGFKKGERRFGNGAKGLLVKNSATTFQYVHRLLLQTPDSAEVARFVEAGYPFEFTEVEERGVVGLSVDGDVYQIEELLAMNLEYVQKLAQADAPNSAVKDCVITVPSSFSQIQRKALLDAASMAGWNVLSLINENSAAAVQYGIDLDYNVNSTETVLFYNMGTKTTEVSLVRFSAYAKKAGRKKNKTVGQGEVLAVVSDDNLGGADFDRIIARFLEEEAQKAFPQFDVLSIPRARAKIRTSAIKAKTILSANPETHIFIESLHKDNDFRAHLTRSHFLELAAPLVERSLVPVSTICSENNLDPNEINIVLIGGGVRIPIIQERLKDFLGGRELKMNLDGDEAMALGAIFRAANLSTTFRPRPFGLVDVTRYPVDVHIFDELAEGQDPEEEFSKHASIFKQYNKVGKKKSVALSHSKDLRVDLLHAAESLPEGIDRLIEGYAITGVEALMENPKYANLTAEADPRVSISFLLDHSGIVHIAKAEATLEEMVQVPIKKKKSKKAKKKSEETTESTAEATESETTNDSTESSEPADSSGSTSTEQPGDSSQDPEGESEGAGSNDESSEEGAGEEPEAEPEPEPEAEPEPQFELKKKTHRIPLKVTVLDNAEATIRLLDRAGKKAIRKRMKDFTSRDALKAELSKVKNDVESHIYRTRSAAYEDFDEVSTEEQREELQAALMEAEDWLFDASDEITRENVKVHSDKFKELQELSDPIYYRVSELERRPMAVANAQELVDRTYDLVIRLAEERPWLPSKDIQKLFNMTRDVEEFLNVSLAAQAELELHDEPAFDSGRLMKKLHPIAKLSQELLKRKEPPPPPEKKEKKKKKKDKKKSGEQTGEGEKAGGEESGQSSDDVDTDSADDTNFESTDDQQTFDESATSDGSEDGSEKDEL